MSIEKTIPIIFNGGAYGTYLEWCLTTLTTNIDIVLPVTATGSNHRFRGRHLVNIDGWRNYVDTKNPVAFVRLHPKTKKDESITNNLESILSTVDQMIYLYPDQHSILLNINNIFTKISTVWWPDTNITDLKKQQQEYEMFADKIYQNWPISRDVLFNDIPQWIKREFLSMYLMPMWLDQVEWCHPERWQHPNCSVVYINNLLDNFKSTIQDIELFLNLKLIKDIDQLIPFHNEMLKHQINYGQDALCNKIINSIIHSIDFTWGDRYLPLPSESWIQWQLRNLGFEIRCDGLNVFPTNSIKLKELLYKI
jgi:hypothetical protein